MKKINYKMSVSDNDKMFLSLGAFGLLCLLWLRLYNPGLFMHLQGRENTPTKLNYSRDGEIFIRWDGMSCYKRA